MNELHRLLTGRQLVLASHSPRRIKLLKDTGLQFRQISPEVDETPYPHEDPIVFAERLAREKAESIKNYLAADEIALSGDTVVIRDNQILGKPIDPEDACRMLASLSGRSHIVCTALALTDGDMTEAGSETTTVYFNRVTSEQIAEYVSAGEPMDKAGAYGIQGIGAFLVDRIEGSLDNVVGLPFNLLYTLAGEFRRRWEEGRVQGG